MIKVFCPRCEKRILPSKSSKAVTWLKNKEISLRTFERIVINTHLRHQHTKYDVILRQMSKKLNRFDAKKRAREKASLALRDWPWNQIKVKKQ